MYKLQIPVLPTLDQPPSWCKSSGAIDRSACVELRVRNVRDLAGCKVYRRGKRWMFKLKRIAVRPLPEERPAEHAYGRLATGVYFISAERLAWVHGFQGPRPLAGDWRGTRARAMRDERLYRPDRRHKNRYTKLRTMIPYPDFALPANPNRSGAQSKKLGLWAEWFQPLRIEMWDARGLGGKPRYWLVCPGHPGVRGSLRHGKIVRDEPVKRPKDLFSMPWVDEETGERKATAELWKAAKVDPRFPPLSNARPGPHRQGCPQRVLKLYMVMCTQAEANDADRAQEWIESIPPAMVPMHRAEIARLEDRYGILFWPRSLMCRQCLGLSYGTHPDRSRESWHRCRARRRGEPIPEWCQPRVPKKVEVMKKRWGKGRRLA